MPRENRVEEAEFLETRRIKHQLQEILRVISSNAMIKIRKDTAIKVISNTRSTERSS